MKDLLIAHIRKNDQAVQTVENHLLESSKIAGLAAAKIGLKESGEILGLLHDIGKACDQFQNYISSANGVIDPDSDDYMNYGDYKGKIDHSTAGAQYIYRLMAQGGKKGEIIGQILALCLASHHSGLIDCLSPDGENLLARRLEKSSEYTHFEESLSYLQPFLDSNVDREMLEVIEEQMTAKIGSLVEKNDKGTPIDSRETLAFKYGLLIRYLFSCVIDADRLSTADFESPADHNIRNKGKYTGWDVLLQRLDRRISEYEEKKDKNSIDVIRNVVSNSCLEFSSRPKGIFQLNVPTGGGKTISSLRFALNHARTHQMDHIFYVVPYTSIIDQNAQEVRKILEEHGPNGNYMDQVVLEHHSNLTPDEESRRHNLLAQNWDAPIIFTTQVQFLETFFGYGTRDVRRLHQLANSVIIFDEVQTLPIKCVQMFNLTLRFLVQSCGDSVVLCTATQPLLDEISPVERALPLKPENKIIKDEKNIYDTLKRVEIIDKRKPGGWEDAELTELALDQLCEIDSVLIVVNTKAAARSLFLKLSQCAETVFHLSTSMCPAHRLSVLQKIRGKLDAHEPVICVSTQLIEAGVDIDFGCVVRCLAGLDSIVQAAGRCNRNGKMEKPGKVFVVNPSNENLDRLHEIQAGAKVTERVWDEFRNKPAAFDNDIAGLKAMTAYYRYYFFEKNSEMDYPVSKRSILGREDDLFSLLSTNPKSYGEYFQGEPEKAAAISLTQSFASASKCFSVIDQSTRGVVVPYEEEGKELINDLCSTAFLEKRIDLIKKAQRYSVNLFSNEFSEMLEKKAISEVQKDSGIYFLDRQYYDQNFGWNMEAVASPETLIF